MDEYQALAQSTAIFPRVFTEHQVKQALVLAYARSDENRGVSLDLIEKWADYDIDGMETEFSRLVYPVLGLVGEAGEIANKLKKVARDCEGQWGPEETADYEGELGDVQWYVAAIATGLKSKLGDIAAKNINKLFSRKARGVLGGSGDNR
jgi:NTP pyrophosphatase (non-canonical NTP hydrolase)